MEARAQLTVGDVMQSPVFVIDEDEYLEDVDGALQERAVSALAVTDESGATVGVISRTDLIDKAIEASRQRTRTLVLPNLRAGEAMSRELLCVSPDDALRDAAALMVARAIHRVLVRDHDALVGVVATREVIRAVERERVETPISAAMSRDIITLPADAPMRVAVERITSARKHGLVVTRGAVPIGIVTMEDLLVAQHWPPTTSVEDWMSPRALCLPETMPLYRAAAHALAWDVRHVIAMNDRGMAGLCTGADFTRAYALATAC
jgi:predicted transcriptional regulator